MQQPTLWGQTIRRVEEFFKHHFIAYGQSLCPFDSRIIGSAPWICIVCTDLRRRLRGEKTRRNCIISGGKKYNKRGPVRAWVMPNHVMCQKAGKMCWLYNDRFTMLMTAFVGIKARILKRDIGIPFKAGVMGVRQIDGVNWLRVLAENTKTGKQKEYTVRWEKWPTLIIVDPVSGKTEVRIVREDEMGRYKNVPSPVIQGSRVLDK